MTPSRLVSRLWIYLVQILAIAFIIAVELGLPHRNLFVPLNFRADGADTIYELTIIKAIIRGGWWWHTEGLSAPAGLALVSMPILGNLDCAVMRMFALFTDRPGLVLNLYWLSTVLAAGPIATWCLVRLGAKRQVAFVIGILYALSPHVYYRNTSQLQLTHHLIPLACTLAALLAIRGGERLRGVTFYALLAGCVFIGFSYIYWAFFATFLIVTGGLAGFLRGRNFRTLRLAGLAAGLVILSAALNLLPSAVSWMSERSGRAMLSFKSPAQADIFGLKIRQLVTPVSHSGLPILARVAARIDSARFPLENENGWSRLGLAASVGFLILLACSVLVVGPRSATLESLTTIAGLTLACILLGTVGGFGSLFNLFVRPDIRAYNRISIFIAFYSLSALSLAIGKALSLLPQHAPASTTPLLLTLVLVAGVVDQSETYWLTREQAQEEKQFRALSDFIGRVERDLPAKAMVYQLPHLPYTDADGSAPRPLRVAQSDPEEPFLFSRSLRWSFPAISSEAVSFGVVVDALNPSDKIETLRDRGFRGICIDRFGYSDDGAALVAGLKDYLRREPLRSGDGRYVFFNIGAGDGHRGERRLYSWGTPLFSGTPAATAPYLVDGWSCVGCTEGTYSTMSFVVPAPAAAVTVRAHLTPALFGNVLERTVRLAVNSVRVGEWKVRSSNWYSVTVPRTALREENRLLLRFDLPDAASPQSLGVNTDRRVLSVSFDELVLSDGPSGQNSRPES